MALTQNTVIGSLTWEPSGAINLRLEKQIVNDATILSSTPHRLAISSVDELEDRLAAVNQNLAADGFPPIAAADVRAEMSRVGALLSSAG